MVKKIMVFVLIFAMAVTLFGCGNSAGTKNENEGQNEEQNAEVAYPEKPITIVVPFKPGATTDLLAQQVAKDLEQELGQPVVVEHKSGGGGAPGLQALKNGADGYTLMLTTSAIVNQVQLLDQVDYESDFQAVARFARSDASLQAPKDTPFKDIGELIEYAKENPGEIQIGVGSVGGNNHISAEIFVEETGIDAVVVPYGSGSENRAATLGGHVHAGVMSIGGSEAQLQSGDMVLLGTMGPERDAKYSDVPTVKELGYDVERVQWYGMFAHKDTPDEITEKLITTLKKIQATPEWKDHLKKLQAEDYASWGEEFEAAVLKQIEQHHKVLKKAGML